MNNTGLDRFTESPNGVHGGLNRKKGVMRLPGERDSHTLRNTLLVLGGIGAATLAAMTPQGQKVLGDLSSEVKVGLARVDDTLTDEEVLAAHEQRLSESYTGQSHVETEIIDVDFEAIEARAAADAERANESLRVARTSAGEYKVQEGDTLSSIMKIKFGETLGEEHVPALLNALGLKSDVLQIDDKLQLPSPFAIHAIFHGMPQG